jgi:hypothetical protein
MPGGFLGQLRLFRFHSARGLRIFIGLSPTLAFSIFAVSKEMNTTDKSTANYNPAVSTNINT